MKIILGMHQQRRAWACSKDLGVEMFPAAMSLWTRVQLWWTPSDDGVPACIFSQACAAAEQREVAWSSTTGSTEGPVQAAF